jgi:hypothetical protein
MTNNLPRDREVIHSQKFPEKTQTQINRVSHILLT